MNTKTNAPKWTLVTKLTDYWDNGPEIEPERYRHSFPSRKEAEQELARQANEVIDNIISDIENDHSVNGSNTSVDDLEFEVDDDFLSVEDTRKALENGVENITIEHGFYEFEGYITAR